MKNNQNLNEEEDAGEDVEEKKKEKRISETCALYLLD